MMIRLAVILLVACTSWTYAADNPQIIDLEIGKPLDLRNLSGANVELTVNAVDISNVTITLRDYDRIVGWDHQPKITRERIKKEDRAVLFSWGRSKVVWIDAMDVAQNHVKVGVVTE